MKTLLWHVAGALETGTHESLRQRGGRRRFILTDDYFPVEARLSCLTAPTGSGVQVDINDDGVSIFDTAPQITPDVTDRIFRSFKAAGRQRIDHNSILTIDIDTVGNKFPGDSLTVELDLVEA